MTIICREYTNHVFDLTVDEGKRTVEPVSREQAQMKKKTSTAEGRWRAKTIPVYDLPSA